MQNTLEKHMFSQLSKSSQNKLTAQMLTRSYRSGEFIHYAGDIAKHLYQVENGVVRICKVSEKGKELIVKDLQAGEWFGFIGCFGLGIRPNDAVALEETRINQISLTAFIKLADTEPELWLTVTKQMAHYVEYYYHTIEAMQFGTLLDRTKAMLRQLCSWQGKLNLKISQKELAALLGVTKEAVGLQLNYLQSQEQISLGYKSIEVLQSLIEE